MRWLLLVAMLGVAAPATAQAPSEPSKDAARALMDEGDRLAALGDLPGALSAYQRADDIMHVPTTTIEVARTLARLGKLAAAQRAAEVVLAHPPSAEEPAPFAQARKEAAQLKADLARRIPTIAVQVPQGGGVVRIDGVVRAAGEPVLVDPGRHEIVVERTGRRAQRDVEVAESRHLTVRLIAEEPPSYVPMMATAGTVLGVSLALGMGFGIDSLLETNDIAAQCPHDRCAPSLSNDLAEAELFANIANVAFGVAGASAIVLAVGLGLELDREPGTSTLEVGASGVTWRTVW